MIITRAAKNLPIISKRWHPANWPKDVSKLERWLITGGKPDGTYTGKEIDGENALSATAVWSAVTQLSQAPASLPLHLYKRVNGGKERATNDPRYKLLNLAPNPEMTALTFREQQMGQVLRYGFSCAEKEFDNSGINIALWPLVSSQVRMERLAGEIFFIVSLPQGGLRILARERILYIPGFTQNGILPYKPIEIARESIGLALAIEEYGARFYGNGARPDIVLEHPQAISAEAQDRLRKSWNEIHQGLEKSHRIAILEEGMKLHQYSTDPVKAQALQTRKYQVEEVARIFNMPVHMLKNLDRSTNNNIEFQGMEFLLWTLRSWLVRLEQAYNTQLFTIEEQKTLFYEHMIDGLLRADTQTRHAAYAHGRQWGYYSANDIREMENKNNIGEQGDIYLIPMNMIPADQIAEGGQQAPPRISNPNLPPEGEEFEMQYSGQRQKRNMSAEDWKQSYEEGVPHWATDLSPSLFAQEFVEKLKDREITGKLLEIGCGNGRDSIFFARAGFDVTAVDIAPGAIKLAQENADKAEVKVGFKEANAEKLPFGDLEFDALFTLSVLHSTNLKKSIPETSRVLRIDGVMVIFIYGNTQYADGKEEIHTTVDEFSTLLKENGYELLDFYSTQEEEFDDAGEKHQCLVSFVRKKDGKE